ncbi:MAG: hypothetical protein Q8P36_00035 [bacterium]|nr:hypothetical protein [bacterium]
MPPSEAILWLFRYSLYVIARVYDYLRLTYPILHTERYCDFRPGEVFLLNFLECVFVLVGIPVVVALWAVGAVPVGYATLAAVALFLLPPAITLGFMELLLLYSKFTRP